MRPEHRKATKDLARELLAPLETRVRRNRMRRAVGGGGRIVIGPWHSEIGFELLYWIPLMRWVTEAFDLAPERAVAVSRGGVASWYEGIADEYVELLEHWSVDEVRDLQRQRVQAFGVQKQVGMLDAERRLLTRIMPDEWAADATVLHPRDMYGLFRFHWSEAQSASVVTRHTVNRPLGPPADEDLDLPPLPDSYVAVKAYFSECFPDNAPNRAFLSTLIKSASESTDVVLLDPDVGIDDHTDFHSDVPTVMSLRNTGPVHQNLALQSRVIAGADALISTYGGFSYLGPYLSVPSLCFFSHDNFNHAHLDVMRRATRELAQNGGGAPFLAVHTADADALSRLASALDGLR